MNRPAPDVLEAARLPALCRGVCLYAGLSLPPATSWNRFVVRSGAEPPELLARLMAEGLSADGIEVQVGTVGDPADRLTASLGRVVVCPGQAQHPPDVAELRSAAAVAGGPVLLFCVERYDQAGRLQEVTWAAVSEEEPPAQHPFRAAVRTYEVG